MASVGLGVCRNLRTAAAEEDRRKQELAELMNSPRRAASDIRPRGESKILIILIGKTEKILMNLIRGRVLRQKSLSLSVLSAPWASTRATYRLAPAYQALGRTSLVGDTTRKLASWNSNS